MSNSMGQLNLLSQDELKYVKDNFRESMKLASAIFSRWAFRKVFDIEERRKPINKALFEVWSVELAKLDEAERRLAYDRKDRIFYAFVKLMNKDENFVGAITSATGDKNRVKYRFATIENLLKQQLHD